MSNPSAQNLPKEKETEADVAVSRRRLPFAATFRSRRSSTKRPPAPIFAAATRFVDAPDAKLAEYRAQKNAPTNRKVRRRAFISPLFAVFAAPRRRRKSPGLTVAVQEPLDQRETGVRLLVRSDADSEAVPPAGIIHEPNKITVAF